MLSYKIGRRNLEDYENMKERSWSNKRAKYSKENLNIENENFVS